MAHATNGTIWTICEQCQRQWADGQGGFVPYVEPAQLGIARDLINWLRKSAPNDTSNLVTLVALQRELAELQANPDVARIVATVGTKHVTEA